MTHWQCEFDARQRIVTRRRPAGWSQGYGTCRCRRLTPLNPSSRTSVFLSAQQLFSPLPLRNRIKYTHSGRGGARFFSLSWSVAICIAKLLLSANIVLRAGAWVAGETCSRRTIVHSFNVNYWASTNIDKPHPRLFSIHDASLSARNDKPQRRKKKATTQEAPGAPQQQKPIGGESFITHSSPPRVQFAPHSKINPPRQYGARQIANISPFVRTLEFE